MDISKQIPSFRIGPKGKQRTTQRTIENVVDCRRYGWEEPCVNHTPFFCDTAINMEQSAYDTG